MCNAKGYHPSDAICIITGWTQDEVQDHIWTMAEAYGLVEKIKELPINDRLEEVGRW
jgi:hypothetical protein